jgi:diaminopropionate ammonia-lyase
VTAPAWYAHRPDPGWTCAPPSPDAAAFHRGLEGYAPTPLADLPGLAAELGVARVFVKDESQRLGLPAFKALGASWALHRALAEHPAEHPSEHPSEHPRLVVAATDGNHGRAVARFAVRAGHRARIVLPDGVGPVAAQAIRDEGAEVFVAGGSYDHAVDTAARVATDEGGLLVQDTAWDGYTDVPGWIVEGYATLFAEVDDELAARGHPGPDLVVVPTGVGSLLHAALAHYRAARPAGHPRTAVLAAEAAAAACLAPSLDAGRPVTVGTRVTVMAGLNCGTPSALAWPYVRDGLDAVAAVDDADDVRAVHDLAAFGVPAGPCGAAALAAARLALTGPGSDGRRAHLGVTAGSTVVLVSTEGADANPLPDDDQHHDHDPDHPARRQP